MIGDQLGMHSTCSDLLACWTVMPHNANASVNAQDPLHASIFPSIPFLRTSSLIILSLVTEIRLEALLSVCVLLLFLFLSFCLLSKRMIQLYLITTAVSGKNGLINV